MTRIQQCAMFMVSACCITAGGGGDHLLMKLSSQFLYFKPPVFPLVVNILGKIPGDCAH